MVGVSKDTVMKLLLDLGDACALYHSEHVRDVPSKRVQCDEIWSFVGMKAKNVPEERRGGEVGDIWTFTAIDADSKLCINFMVGPRDASTATTFLTDIADRLAGRVQLTTDGHLMYLEAVERAFGSELDFAQLVKRYGTEPEGEKRYSPAKCLGADKRKVTGNPDSAHISTSYVERSNLTMRMSIRRFTRLTNAFSKKLRNHVAAIALYTMHYNYCRPHSAIRTKSNNRITPAMKAGLADHQWKLEELIALLPPVEHKGGRPRKVETI